MASRSLIPVPTIKDVAERAGVSTATVSLALRHSPRIRATTAERVRRAAESLGYTPNPLVAALMARIRDAEPSRDQVALGVIHVGEDERNAPNAPYLDAIFAGARARAAQLGFQSALFHSAESGLSARRLGEILLTRGIHGLIILPSADLDLRLDLDWARFAAVAIGYSLVEPPLHRVCSDHFQELAEALEHLEARGYRRIGLHLDRSTDLRVRHKWAALMAWHARQRLRSRAVPALVQPAFDREAFLGWYRRHRPDVVISPRQWVIEWLKEDGRSVPGDVGFVHLNWTERSGPCSGIDQRPQIIGAAAAETVIAQLHRNERGVPEVARTVSIEGRWVEGPTTRGVAGV
jgi:LacI family transcriptional regulator